MRLAALAPENWTDGTFRAAQLCGEDSHSSQAQAESVLIHENVFTGNIDNSENLLSTLGPSGSDGKESTCNAGDKRLILGLGRFPGGGHGNPLQYSGLENPHGQRSLAGSSPRGHQESDTTE